MKSRIVYSADGRSLIKQCRSTDECRNELRVYQLGLSWTPELLKIVDERSIEIARIEGASFSTRLDFDPALAGKMLADLHRAKPEGEMVICHLDTNPRNYLIEEKSGRYYFIDFAESGYSFPENDLVNFLLFWAAILPGERFQQMMKDFLQGYQAKGLLDPERRKEYFGKWFDIFDERRRKYCKRPGTVEEWQRQNRSYLLEMFYQLVI